MADDVRIHSLRQVAQRISTWGPRLMDTAFQHIEEFLIAFAISLGGVILGFIVYRVIMCCDSRARGRVMYEEVGKYHQIRRDGDLEWQLDDGSKDPNKKTPLKDIIWGRWSGTTTRHLIALFLRTLIVILGLYVAFDTIGVDVGTLVASLGIVAAIVTFAARDLIVNTAAAFCLMLSGLVQEGMYLVVVGSTTYKGRVDRINAMTTLLVEQDGTLGHLVTHSIPNSMFYSVVVSRIFDKEKGIDVEGFKTMKLEPLKASLLKSQKLV